MSDTATNSRLTISASTQHETRTLRAYTVFNPPTVVNVRPSIRTSAIWMLCGRIVYSAAQIGILVVLGRIGGSLAVGEFVFALALTGPIVVLFNLNLRIVMATDVRGDYTFHEYAALRNWMTLLMLVCIVAAAVVAGTRFHDSTVVILAVGISKIIESISDIRYGPMQRAERISVIARSLLLRGPIGLAMSAVAYFYFHSIVAVAVALSMCWGAVLLLHDIPTSRSIERNDERSESGRSAMSAADRRRRLQRLAWQSLPLGIASTLLSLEANVPRYVVADMFGASLLGVVGLLTYLLGVFQTISNALCYPAIPRLAHHFDERCYHEFAHLLIRLCILSAAMGICVFVAVTAIGPTRLLGVIGPEFASHGSLLLLIIAAASVQLLQQLLLGALRSMRQFRSVLANQIISLTLTSVLCLGFVHWKGIVGIGYAILISFSVCALMTIETIWRKLRELNSAAGNIVSLEAYRPSTLEKIAC